MTATLSQSQAELPKLVEIASRGEDVLITVDGKPKARLTSAEIPEQKTLSEQDLKQWLSELEELRRKCSTGKTTPTAQEILDEDRADRV